MFREAFICMGAWEATVDTFQGHRKQKKLVDCNYET